MPIWNPLDENLMTNREKSIAAVLDKWTHEQWQEFNRTYGMSCPLGKLTRMVGNNPYMGAVEGEIRWRGEQVLSPGDLGQIFCQVEGLCQEFIEIRMPLKTAED